MHGDGPDARREDVDEVDYPDMDDITFVGLDVHKATVAVAVAEGGRAGEVRRVGVVENRPAVLAKLADRLAKDGRHLKFCYEAGPCGYGLHRFLTARGHACTMVARRR
jgi:transposase